MFGLLEKIEKAIREFFIGLVQNNLTTMFTDVNEKTAKSILISCGARLAPFDI